MRQRGIRGGSPDDLADEFFGWFFEKQIHRRLSRDGADGRVQRFRGYLKRCVITFVRESLRGRGAGEVDADLAAPDADVSRAIDEEYCHQAIAAELSVIQRDEPSLWSALMADLDGQPAEEVARRMAGADGDGDGPSLPSRATAFRQRQRARAAVRNRLLRWRLASGTLDASEAESEFHELLPLLANAMHAYVMAHRRR